MCKIQSCVVNDIKVCLIPCIVQKNVKVTTQFKTNLSQDKNCQVNILNVVKTKQKPTNYQGAMWEQESYNVNPKESKN